jgi:hypothetical protein
LFLEKTAFQRVTLKAEKQFQNAYKEPHEVVFIDQNSDVLAYMHYIGDSYPASLIVLVANTPTQKFSFCHLGKKSTLAIMKMKTSNKPN